VQLIAAEIKQLAHEMLYVIEYKLSIYDAQVILINHPLEPETKLENC
jgi:hypothetical protein